MILHGVVSKRVGASGALQYFENDGASTPWYGVPIYPNVFYDVTSDLYAVAWEASHPSGLGGTRAEESRAYLRSTGKWTPIGTIGSVTLGADDHGNPSICKLPSGYYLSVYGGHVGSLFEHSVTLSPHDLCNWAARSSIGSNEAYPHLSVVGSTIYLFHRNEADPTRKYLGLYTGTESGSPPFMSWTLVGNVVDFGPNTRAYQGNTVIVGTDIHFGMSKADDQDQYRVNLYHFVFNTLDGSIRNYENTFSVAAGSLPVGLADADANFKLYTHPANHSGGIPALVLDDGNLPHYIIVDGLVTGNFDNDYLPPNYGVFKHVMNSGPPASPGTWTTTTIGYNTTGKYDGACIWALTGGVVSMAWATDPSLIYDRGGQYIYAATRDNAGVWSAPTTINTATDYPLNSPSAVLGGLSDLRWIYSQAVNDPPNLSGLLKGYGRGDSAPLAFTAPALPANACTYVASGTAVNGNNVSLTPTLPGGSVAGQRAVSMFVTRNNAGTVTAPSGWTSLAGNVGNAFQGGFKFYLAHNLLVGSDADPVWTYSGSSGDSVCAQTFTVASSNAATPIGTIGTVHSSTTDTTTAGPVTGAMAASAGDLIVCAFAFRYNFSAVSDPPNLAVGGDYTPWTKIGDKDSTTGNLSAMSWSCGTLYFDTAAVVSKNLNNLHVTGASTGNLGVQFVIKHA